MAHVLVSHSQDVFPAGTDISDLYTADLYSTAPQFSKGMHNEPFTKSMLATVGDRTPGAQTSLHHCSFHCNGMEFLPAAGEWSTLLQDDMKSVQCPVPPQGTYTLPFFVQSNLSMSRMPFVSTNGLLGSRAHMHALSLGEVSFLFCRSTQLER